MNSIKVFGEVINYLENIIPGGSEIDYDNFYGCEVYTHERYCQPLNKGEKVTIDYIIPVKGSAANE